MRYTRACARAHTHTHTAVAYPHVRALYESGSWLPGCDGVQHGTMIMMHEV